MAGLARGMRPGRRRGGRTGRPMRQGPHPADASRGALPRARRGASQDQKACRDACLQCDTKESSSSVARMRLSETTDDRKTEDSGGMRGFAGLRFWSPPKVVSVQFCTKQTCAKVHPGSGQKGCNFRHNVSARSCRKWRASLAQARPEGMQVHVRPDTGRKEAK